MRINSAAALAAVIFVALSASCVGVPATDPGLPGAESGKPVPQELTEAEKERMELDAIYRAIEAGEYAQAESRLAALATAKPDNRSYPVLRAAVLLSMDRLPDARVALTAELAAYPDNAEALFALAELERFDGNPKAHRAAIEALVAKDPGNADAQAALGDIHYEGKNYKKAEEAFAASLAAAPDNVEALLGLARVEYRRDDAKAALELLDRAVAVAPGDAIAYLDRSRALYDLGRYAECEADMDTAVRLAPESSWNYLERGRLYLDTGRKELALADFSESIRLVPDYFLPYVYRGSIYESAGNDAAALADYRAVSALYPDYWYSLESEGVLAYRLGRWSEAFDAFDRASAYTKAHPEYYVAAAVSLFRSGDAKAAKEYAGKNLAKISREKNPLQWLALRLVYDQGEMTSELEIGIGAEKSLDVKAGMLFYLGAYWVGKGRIDLGSNYIRMSYDSERIGTIERRMAEADLARLAAPK